MLLPIRWLKDYIKTEKTARELADGLTNSGSHVESIESLGNNLENVVVGKIISIEKHGEKDSLLICQVDIGGERLQIVTGAKNIFEGALVAVAKVGSRLPAMEIGESEFSGVKSQGMMCSLKELGYSDNVISKEMKEGLLILEGDYELGMDLVRAISLDQEIIEFEITPNRPDCLSIIGMARETKASFDLDLIEPKIEIKNQVDHISDYLDNIKIETKNCIRYAAKVVKDVKVKESPLWMQLKLMEAGIRPISNIVDITNYVMLEYGEPLHAFDLNQIKTRKILVRAGKDGEKFKTLDDVEREIKEGDVLITDGENIVAIGGVMGGLDSEITETTSEVLLEAANFSDKAVRMTSKRLGLRTEASTRFEKGVDPSICLKALERVCQLIEEVGAGTIVEGSIDVDNSKLEKTLISLRPDRVNKLLGIEIGQDQMIKYLNLLDLKSSLKGSVIETEIPSFRRDIEIEADLIEEIGRLYGFHNIESKPLVGLLTRGEKPYDKVIEDRAKVVLQGLGYNEIMTYSFISPRAYDKINLPENSIYRNYIKLINPLGEDYSVMRTTLVPNMLDLLSRNNKRGVEKAFAYEIGNTFIPKELPVEQLPEEKKYMALGYYGEYDFYFLKETVETLLNRMGIYNIRYSREENDPSYHPGRTARIYSGQEELGIIGEIHVDVTENYNIRDRVYIGNLDFDKIVELADFERKYKPLPKYPSTSRDIAIVVDEDTLFGDIEDLVRFHGEELVEEINLFDIYRGTQVPEGKKSMAISIVYRSLEKTLKDEDVNSIQDKIIRDLEEKLGGKLRA